MIHYHVAEDVQEFAQSMLGGTANIKVAGSNWVFGEITEVGVEDFTIDGMTVRFDEVSNYAE